MILEQLYDGNINPANLKALKTVRGEYYARQRERLLNQLLEKLDEHEKKLLLAIQDTEGATDAVVAHDAFMHGFKLATMHRMKKKPHRSRSALKKSPPACASCTKPTAFVRASRRPPPQYAKRYGRQS